MADSAAKWVNDNEDYRELWEILRTIWGTTGPVPFQGSLPYIIYCWEQWNVLALSENARHTTIRSHADAAPLIRRILEGKDHTEILSSILPPAPLAQAHRDEAARRAQTSLDLLSRMCVLVSIGRNPTEMSSLENLRWSSGTLKDFISGQFTKTTTLKADRLRLQKTFDAWALWVVAGIQISFTSNLADHLLLTDDDTTLQVFHQVTFLKHQNRNLYPEDFVRETLNTISLLFPQAEFGTRSRSPRKKVKFFQNLRRGYGLTDAIDEHVVHCGTLRTHARQFEKFKYWHDRLVILKQAFDESPPRTLSQWWHDDRNYERWWMFWVVVFLFLISTPLTIIQAIEGGIQVYKAYNPGAG
ncbi:hypothetical protein PG985_008727 [Apiospora marii]|uniref:uncharacterized protein n=1 Tax=Apiospora marii TaxID=335849 RepID=UPI00312ED2F0